MTSMHERGILKEFIEMYRDSPCLWDMSSELYRNKEMKHHAWGQMTDILRKLDPDSNLCTTKKKVENLRAVYFRELKKVKASERTATEKADLFVPNLWYFKLINFLDSKDWGPCRASDPLQCDIDIKPAPTSDEESIESAEWLEEIEPEIPFKRKSLSNSQSGARKHKKPETASIQTFVEPEPKLHQEQKKTNYFGIYIGEQLEQVSSFQRNVAERLISEVLFLAKTGNLNYESKIEPQVGQATEYNEILSPGKVEKAETRPRALLKELLSDK